jgi:hypothetical protein
MKQLLLAIVTILCCHQTLLADPPEKKAETFFIQLFGINSCDDPCPMDFANDGYVGVKDFYEFLNTWGFETTDGCDAGDYDEDGQVEVDDLRIFMAQFGYECE